MTLRFANDHQQQRKEEELMEEDIYFSAEKFVEPLQFAYHRYLVLGIVVIAIFLTTSVMSLLEPCLPLWLMKTMKPEVGIDLI